jgi:hypothetical protein
MESIPEQIQRLANLHRSGALTDQEFQQAKVKLISPLYTPLQVDPRVQRPIAVSKAGKAHVRDSHGGKLFKFAFVALIYIVIPSIIYGIYTSTGDDTRSLNVDGRNPTIVQYCSESNGGGGELGPELCATLGE